MSPYRIAPIFLIRMAGVPFDHLEKIATSAVSHLGRELLHCRSRLSAARETAERLVSSPTCGLSAEMSRECRNILRTGRVSPLVEEQLPESFSRFASVFREMSALEDSLSRILPGELEASRVALTQATSAVLPDYLVFGAGEFRDRLPEAHRTAADLPPRNSRTRERERHLLLYLQRVCGKNDTFSSFGPSAWGTIEREVEGVLLENVEAGPKRIFFLERWAAHSLAAALNQDAEARLEVAPRLNPNGRVAGDSFVFADSDEVVSLTSENLTLLRKCDGRTPAHSLGVPIAALEDLAANGIVRWECEVPALDPSAFSVLSEDISQWRNTAVRQRWLDRAQSVAEVLSCFAKSRDAGERRSFMAAAQSLLLEMDPRPRATQRSLYAAANPIVEECFRPCRFRVEEKLADTLTDDAAPWFDLWRDTYGFVASRVAAGLRTLFATARVQGGAVPLPAFLKHCADNKMALTGPGMVVMAHLAFQEVKTAFRQLAQGRTDRPEWKLTAEDCAFVRRQFEYEKFDEYTYPSADLQLSAASFEGIARGEYEWIVSELHPPVAMMHHALYWSCPDPEQLSKALGQAAGQRPAFDFGFFASDFTAHTTLRHMDALPDLMTFVSDRRGNSRWRSIPPAEAEVFVDEKTNDVGLRTREGKHYLGSFARAWLIPLGFHPFQFSMPPHTPRLRCGRVIVQRQSWVVTQEELPSGDYTGVSRDLVLAIEQLRAEKGWPRYIYMRPTEQALRRSGAEGRDKDTKPVFVDLESYLSLEIFHRWLVKAGELEVTEMLPDPDHLCWQESDGRRTFELRTLIVPRS